MRKPSLLSFAATGLLLVGFGCNPAPAPSQNGNTPSNGQALGSQVTLLVGETVTYTDGLSVKLEAINDSRCKDGVVCIWEGELAAVLHLNGSAADVVTLGANTNPQLTKDGHTFMLDGITETSADLKVTVAEPQLPPAQGTGDCRPTGCSGQICASEDMVSDCMYRPEYACYDGATCERQPGGECGWTQTETLTACLQSSATVTQ